jgi:uncharacterized protein YggU (UPF0235/DUF167 family)
MAESAGSKNEIKITSGQNAAVFYVKAVPASSKTCFAGVQNGMLRVKLAAAPEKGKANQALVEFLSEKTGIKKKFIRITAGLTSKVKQITIEQETAESLTEKLKIVL